MIRIVREISLDEFEAWSGAVPVLDKIIELDLVSEAETYINEVFGYEAITDTALNDLLWFDMDSFFKEYGVEI